MRISVGKCYSCDARWWIGLLVTAVFVLFSLPGCSAGPAGPTEIPEWIRVEWAIGECRVAALNPPPKRNPQANLLDGYRFIEEPGVFRCGNQPEANGCHSYGSRTIRYNVQTPTVIRHEAGHAILHALSDPRASEFEHHHEKGDPQFAATFPQPPNACQ